MTPKLQRLVNAGIVTNLDGLTHVVGGQFESLSDAEIDALVSIRSKINPSDLDDKADNLLIPL